jgi:hypothetical protein
MNEPAGMAPAAGMVAGGGVLSTTVPPDPSVHPGVAGVGGEGAAVVLVVDGGANTAGDTWAPDPAQPAATTEAAASRTAQPHDRRLTGTRRFSA